MGFFQKGHFMDFQVLYVGEVVPDLVNYIVRRLAFYSRNRRNRLEVGEINFIECGQFK